MEEFQIVERMLNARFNITVHSAFKEYSLYHEILGSNYLYSVTLMNPSKADRLQYFQTHDYRQLPRIAKAIVVYGGDTQKLKITTFSVGPLNSPDKVQITEIAEVPFLRRPFTNTELEAVDDFLLIQCAKMAQIIESTYEASYHRAKPSKRWPYHYYGPSTNFCLQHSKNASGLGNPHCLKFMFASPMVTVHFPKTRVLWARLNRDVSPFNQYPIDLHFGINTTQIDPTKWTLLQIWFQGREFPSVAELKRQIMDKRIIPIKRPFRDMYPNQFKKFNTGSSENSSPVPKRIENLQIEKRFVKYRNWKLHLAFRHDTGLQFHGAHFAGKLLLSELILDETTTVYSGKSPFVKNMISLESQFGVGRMISELSAGIDCPSDAIFLPLRLVEADILQERVVKQGVCVFERTAMPIEGPSRRHFEFFSPESGFAFGLPSRSLVIRSITSLFNYDYIFDLVLDPSGGLHYSVTPTGYIHVDIDLDGSMQFGFLSATTETQLFYPIHSHLFLIKVDLDVIQTSNNFKIVRVFGDRSENSDYMMELMVEQVQFEGQARIKYNFTRPKQFLFCEKGQLPKGPLSRCLEVRNKGMVYPLYQALRSRSFSWIEQVLFVAFHASIETK
ncbi:actin binding protein [Cichlidogyrus casuarinus]|uniref:Amine oxidase n=1 Tax=Cichlidogyrus casuarinus TaxID=1844966 RepID=A0ABD2QN90_9PLAT